ncbi:hypothetical protein BJX99DRAFT_258181 [Aspergillus californicus]
MIYSALDEASFMMIRPRRNWTAEEDVVLKREVRRAQGEGDNISWHEIAAFLPGRTNKDCRKRWYGTAAAKVKKGPWTEAEDERLRRAIDRHGTKWAVVASVVGTRLPDQCSKRWSHAINPEIDHSPWTTQEDELLMQKVNKHGHYWQQIVSLYFPGRTSLAAKNRYHILQRRMRSDAGAVGSVCGLEGADVNSWQDLLRWPENTQRVSVDARGNDQGLYATPATSSDTGMTTAYDTDYFMSEPRRTDWSLPSRSPLYDPPSGFDMETIGFPVPRVDDPATALNCTFPSAITVDDLVFQAALSPSISISASDTVPTSDSSTASNPRRICIHAVCATEKLGAIFEAVTKFSISAVIKTDD